jgi:outer membrane protein OmpA-like peptidoglycan-associated protein
MSRPLAANRWVATAVAGLLIGTLTAGVVAWRHVGKLRAEISELRAGIAGLGEELRQAEERFVQVQAWGQEEEQRAEQAEERAAGAEELAARLAERAEGAEAAADAAEKLAFSERESAAAATQQAERAQQERAEALERSQEARQLAQQAFLEAERAKREAAELRRQRELELDRLARALDQIADTRRTALGLVMDLGDSIEFDFDRAELRPQNRELLARIAGVLLTAEDFGIQVYGHTDDVGSPGYNQRLSERRAESVRRYLVASGVPTAAITATGFGMSRPLVAGSSDVARQRNRRVEIAVVQISGESPLEPVVELERDRP